MKSAKPNKKTVYRNLVIIILLVDLYCGSFVILAKPCNNINRAPDDSYRETAKLPAYPNGTVLCVSESPKVNAIAYWFYRPLSLLIEYRGFAFFVYDPTKEAWEQPRR